MPAVERSPRERMVYAAAQLIRARGITGTGLRDVVSDADAPRGSLQHYFPGGKNQVVSEALRWAGGYAGRRVTRYIETARSPSPGGLFAFMVRQWRDEFTADGYARGCPLVAAAADTAAWSDPLREEVGAAFTDWLEPVAGALVSMGVPTRRAQSLADLMISTLEGAIVLARVRRDLAPLATAERELRPILDAAVR